VLLQDGTVADRFVDDDIVLREFCAERRKHERRSQRAGNTLVGARVSAAFFGSFAGAAPAFDARGDTATIGVVGPRLHRLEHLRQHDGAVALDAQIRRKSPHRKVGLERIDIDLDPAHRAGALRGVRNERHVGVK